MTEETEAGQETTQPGGEQSQAESSEQSQTQGEQTQQTEGGETTEGEQGEQTAGEQTSEDETGEGPPEDYEFQAPEGMELDQQMLEQFKPLAKELGLSQEAAQKFVDMYAERMQGFQQERENAIAQQQQQWADQAKQDEEIGGEQFDQNVETARKAIDTFGSDDLKGFLDETGLGNHPEMIRFAARVGAKISEDTLIPGGQGGGQSKSAADVLFDNS